MTPSSAFPVSLCLSGSENKWEIFVFGFGEEHVKSKLSFFLNSFEAETIRDPL